MRAGATLLVVEHVLPEGDGPSFGKLLDLHMMVLTGGLERTEAEYRRLFAAHGFRLTRVVPPRVTSPSSRVCPPDSESPSAGAGWLRDRNPRMCMLEAHNVAPAICQEMVDGVWSYRKRPEAARHGERRE